MGAIEDALDIYREQGAHALSYRASDFICYRLRDLADTSFASYWDLRGGRQVVEIGDLSATFDAHSSRGGPTIRRHATTEREMLSDMISRLHDDDIVYDIGANLGFYSAFASTLGSKVYAFEPYRPNFDQLKRNVSYNDGDVEPFELALSDENGEIEFTAPTSMVGYGTGRIGEGEWTVETRRGDDLIDELGLDLPDVVKIDVEGAEAAVAGGMWNALDSCRLLYVELHLPADHRPSAVREPPSDLLCDIRDRGFETRILGNRGEEIQIVAERR